MLATDAILDRTTAGPGGAVSGRAAGSAAGTLTGAGAAAPVVLERARGWAEIAFKLSAGATRVDRLFQEGQAKIRLPRGEPGDPPTAVVINTAGGVTGGDRLDIAASWGPGTTATVTGQAAERIYRSSGGAGTIHNRLSVGAGATAEWLPQETILFDRSRLARRLEVDLAADARCLIVESVFFGRGAMGERVTDGALSDHWRLRRDGRLVLAESFRAGGDTTALFAGRATGGGAIAFATLLYAAPDADRHLDRLRRLVDDDAREPTVEAGTSAFDGFLVARFLSSSPQALRRDLVRILEAFRGRPMPRPWSC